MQNNQNEIILYQPDNTIRLDVMVDNETVWLSLNQMVSLFDRDKSVISRHIKNVFDEGELSKNSVVANFATTAKDGKTYDVDFYNLDVIISCLLTIRFITLAHRSKIWERNFLHFQKWK